MLFRSVNLLGNSIYYLPLLIVQCILMGATIDYGILYTSYYVEARNNMGVKEAVIFALNNSIHTIMTSGAILITVTLAIGILLPSSQYAISAILLTIARGGISSTVLVVFILPSVMAALDKFVIKKKTQGKGFRRLKNQKQRKRRAT